jgi:hypothetical protein
MTWALTIAGSRALAANSTFDNILNLNSEQTQRNGARSYSLCILVIIRCYDLN